MPKRMLRLTINGDAMELLVSPQQTLLDVIRDQVGLMGTKEGCTTGSCGVCTINNAQGEAILSCLTPALEWDGAAITTIEGLESQGELDAIQKSFVAYHAVQCGVRTPGVIMSAKAVLNRNSRPTDVEINDGMAGVICRCTGHIKVKEAIRNAHEFTGAGVTVSVSGGDQSAHDR